MDSEPVTPPEIAPDSETGAPDKNVRTMAMLCHLLAFCGLVIPLGNFLGPLVIWLIKKDEHPFIDANGKESLNFQITLLIPSLILVIPGLIIPPVACIAIPLIIVIAIVAIVFVIIASMKTNEGETYAYPFALRLIK